MTRVAGNGARPNWLKPGSPPLLGGRVVADVAVAIHDRYLQNGDTPTRPFLPAQRRLAGEFQVSLSTIQRALTMLQAQGYVSTEHGRGSRILVGDGHAPFRVAVLQAPNHNFGMTMPQLVEAIHGACLRRKWQVLSLDVEDLDPMALLRTLQDAGVQAAVLPVAERQIVQPLVAAGLLCVAVESATSGVEIDLVSQDNFGAGAAAARHLLQRGHSRLGWIGPTEATDTAFARFQGARSALVREGRDFQPGDVLPFFETPAETDAYLQDPARPRAILSLWAGNSIGLIKSAVRLGLGEENLDLVGWGLDRHLEEVALDILVGRVPVASVVWSIAAMADVVASRIHLHRIEPGLHPLCVMIPAQVVEMRDYTARVRDGGPVRSPGTMDKPRQGAEKGERNENAG